MPSKLKKSSKVSKGSKTRNKSKKKSKSSISRKKKNSKIMDPVEREAARSRALEARLYFQRADLSKTKVHLQQAEKLKSIAEAELEDFKLTVEEVSAFTTWQHEHTVEKLTDRISELTAANSNLTAERNNLQDRLTTTLEESKATIAARDSEIARLQNVIKESHYKYEKVFQMFAEALVERLTTEWECETPFLRSLEDSMCYEFMQAGLVSTFDD